jgi:hypothetical protein
MGSNRNASQGRAHLFYPRFLIRRTRQFAAIIAYLEGIIPADALFSDVCLLNCTYDDAFLELDLFI